jgi:uncharacterized protein YlbG (UPF0298 family)
MSALIPLDKAIQIGQELAELKRQNIASATQRVAEKYDVSQKGVLTQYRRLDKHTELYNLMQYLHKNHHKHIVMLLNSTHRRQELAEYGLVTTFSRQQYTLVFCEPHEIIKRSDTLKRRQFLAAQRAEKKDSKGKMPDFSGENIEEKRPVTRVSAVTQRPAQPGGSMGDM